MNDRRQIFGWAMYDWANSAYITTVTVAVLPIFFADVVVGPNGFAVGGIVFRATTLWAWTIGLASFLIFMAAPFLGAISDFSATKKKFLMAFCYAGSIGTILLYYSGAGDVISTIILFTIAQVGFVGGNVFYDAFLPQIASDDRIDWVSGVGFAWGYIGGGLHLALSIALISLHERIGIPQEMSARIAIASAGLWWGAFAAFTFASLRESSTATPIPDKYRGMNHITAVIRIGIDRTLATARHAGRFKHLVLFLIAFMIYNNGIQTVITLATIYGRAELGFSSADLMLTLLIIQFVAFFGSLIFGKLAQVLSSKTALMITLFLWSGVVIYAYFMTRPLEYYLLGVIVGLSMGGSQALSRSLYGSMIPVEASAEFYGFYSVSSKFSAIWGPLAFGIIDMLTGSSRQAILSLIVFFIIGMILLVFVDVNRAREARTSVMYDAAAP